MEFQLKNPTCYKQMVAWVRKSRIWLICLLACLFSAPAWAELAPYEARYSIYRNGKLISSVREQPGDLGENSMNFPLFSRRCRREPVVEFHHCHGLNKGRGPPGRDIKQQTRHLSANR